ncbi:MAG: hypothetical protein WCG25_02465 [bacterium]
MSICDSVNVMLFSCPGFFASVILSTPRHAKNIIYPSFHLPAGRQGSG